MVFVIVKAAFGQPALKKAGSGARSLPIVVAWVHFPAERFTNSSPDITTLCQKREPKYRSKSKNLSAAELTSIKVRCKKREHVTGGGVSITGGTLDAHVISSYPIDSSDKGRVPDDGWKVVASSDNAVPKKFTAYAICAGKQGKA